MTDTTREEKRIRTRVGEIFASRRNTKDLIHVALNKTERDIAIYVQSEITKAQEQLLDELQQNDVLFGAFDMSNPEEKGKAMVVNDVHILIEAKRKEIKGEK